MVHKSVVAFSFLPFPLTLPEGFLDEMYHDPLPFQPGITVNQPSGHDLFQPTSDSPLTSFMPKEEAIPQDNASDQSEELDKPGKRSGGRRKINIEYIQDKSKRHITFSKRKAGLMKKVFQRIHTRTIWISN